MLRGLSRTKCGPIGLDVGAGGVKMLQLGRSGDKRYVVSAGRWPFPPTPQEYTADPQQHRRMAAQGIGELLRKGSFRGRDVVSCLRAVQMSVKNVRLPHMPEHELTNAVVWECQERFGFDVSPDRVPYVNAGEVRQGTEVRDEIILMGVSAETIAEHLEMLSEARLHPIHIDAEAACLFRTYQRFLRRAEDESIISVIVDIGVGATKVIVARGSTIVLIKATDIAGHQFNESVAKELGLSYDEAVHLRRRGFRGQAVGEAGAGPASGVEWSVFDAIREQVQALAREISLCLRYCSVTFRGLRPETITLTGGEAHDATLMRLLAEHLDCECVVGDPLRGIDLGDVDLGGDRRGPLTEWSVATGLALRGLGSGVRTETTDDDGSRLSA